MKKTGVLVVLVAVCALLAGYGIYAYTSGNSAKTTIVQKTPAGGKEGTSVKNDSNGQNAAMVNGVAIPKSDYDAEVTRFDRQMAMSGRNVDEKDASTMRTKILDNMIGRELLKQEAAKQQIKADDAETSAQLETLKKRFGSEEDFKNALARMSITEQALKDQFVTESILRKLVDRDVASKITLAPDDAKKFYDENPEMFKSPETVRASHILVKVEENASPEDKAKALEKIKGIQKRIQKGEDFAVVAKEVSDCPSKENGGDLNYFQRGQMVGPFENAAFSLKPGQMSDIVETEYGYHLIKLTDRKDAGVMSFEEMKPRIEQHIKSEKVGQQLTVYVDQLRAAAKIDILVK